MIIPILYECKGTVVLPAKADRRSASKNHRKHDSACGENIKSKKAEQSFSAGKLTLVKFFIKTVGAEQFIMSSAFNYAPAAHNKDNIRLANG